MTKNSRHSPSLLDASIVYAAYKIGMTDKWLETKLLEFQR